MQPASSRRRRSSGTAVISLLFAAVRSWPRTSRLPCAQALTRCTGPPPAPPLRRRVLPSRARISPGSAVRRLCVQAVNASANCAGSSAAKTRPKVSWLGMPWGSSSEAAQPLALGLAKLLHLRKALRAAAQRADGDDQDVIERMAFGALDARVGELGEGLDEAVRVGSPKLLPTPPPKVQLQ